MQKLNLSLWSFREVTKLIKSQCCNYYQNNCLLLDDGDTHTCPQLITPSHIICKYFLEAVLPGNKTLMKSIKEQTAIETITCVMCGKKTERTGRNQKYCTECAKLKQRQRNAEFMAGKRSKDGCL